MSMNRRHPCLALYVLSSAYLVPTALFEVIPDRKSEGRLSRKNQHTNELSMSPAELGPCY
jgi:hypothetical protein